VIKDVFKIKVGSKGQKYFYNKKLLLTFHSIQLETTQFSPTAYETNEGYGNQI